MSIGLKKYISVVLVCLLSYASKGQLIVSGTVYDSTKIVPVKDVIVKSSCGEIAISDTVGKYHITVDKNDSLIFIYQNKSTEKFPVSKIKVFDDFNISLQIKVTEKFRTLREVRVFGKSFKQDSLENRISYSKIFNYDRPGISTTSSSGTPGLDLDEFINMFRFRRNKQMAAMQKRLLSEEQERYTNYRFNKTLVKRITGLSGKDLDEFLKTYRPTYEFSLQSSTTEFYQYILNCSYFFKQSVQK